MKPTYEDLQQQLAALDAINRQLNDRVAAQAEELAAAGRTIEALAAENEVIKQFGGKLNEMHGRLNGEGVGIQGSAEVACQQIALESAMEEFDAIETTATDAAIAEIRAQGAEALTDRLQQLLDEGHFAGNEVAVMAGAIHCGRDMAQQLRAEASKC